MFLFCLSDDFNNNAWIPNTRLVEAKLMERNHIIIEIIFSFSSSLYRADFYELIHTCLNYIDDIPGKWLIFWYCYIFNKVSGRTALSVQKTSQSEFSGSVNTFQDNIFATSFKTGYWQSKLVRFYLINL